MSAAIHFQDVHALLGAPLAAYSATATYSVESHKRAERTLLSDIAAALVTFAEAHDATAPSLEDITQADTHALGHTDWRTKMAVQLRRLLAA